MHRHDPSDETHDDSSATPNSDQVRSRRKLGLGWLLARVEPEPATWTLTHAGVDHKVGVRPVPGKPWKVSLSWVIDGTPIGECVVSPWSPADRKPSDHPQRRGWLRAGDFSFPKDTPTDVKTSAYAARRKMTGCTLSYGLGVTYWHVVDLDFTPPEKGQNADPELHEVGVQLVPPAGTAAARHVDRMQRHPTLTALTPIITAAVRIFLMFIPAFLFALVLWSFRLPSWSFPQIPWPSIPWPPSWWPSFSLPRIPWPSIPWPPSWWPEWSLPIPEWLRRIMAFVAEYHRAILIAVGAVLLSRRYLRRNHARNKRRTQTTQRPSQQQDPTNEQGVDAGFATRHDALTHLAQSLHARKNQLHSETDRKFDH